jgi:hypothetical protein
MIENDFWTTAGFGWILGRNERGLNKNESENERSENSHGVMLVAVEYQK